MSINLWYDYILGNEIVNNLIPKKEISDFLFFKRKRFDQLRQNAILPDFLRKNNIDHNIIPSVTAYKITKEDSTRQFFPIELNWIKNEPLDFNFRDSHFLKYRSESTTFLIWFPSEAPDFFFKNIFYYLKEKYPKFEIRFVHGNLKKPEFVKDLNYIDYRSFDYFWWNEQQFECPELNINRVEKKVFSFYNNRIKLHRSIPYYRLMKSGFLDNADCTFNGVFTGSHQSGDKQKDLISDWKYHNKNLKYLETNKKEYQSYLCDHEFLDWNLSKMSYSNVIENLKDIRSDTLNNLSYLDVVTETCAIDSDNLFFITEKTYRPITRGCIFLILGNLGTLSYLKSKGIETFDDLFDESYDNTHHWFNRWKIIEKNLEIWMQLGEKGRLDYYKKNFDKLRHNQNVIYSRNFKEEIESLFE